MGLLTSQRREGYGETTGHGSHSTRSRGGSQRSGPRLPPAGCTLHFARRWSTCGKEATKIGPQQGRTARSGGNSVDDTTSTTRERVMNRRTGVEKCVGAAAVEPGPARDRVRGCFGSGAPTGCIAGSARAITRLRVVLVIRNAGCT